MRQRGRENMTREKRGRGEGEKRLNEVGMQARAERDQRDGGCVSLAAEQWSLLLSLFALSGASRTSTAQISLPSLSCLNTNIHRGTWKQTKNLAHSSSSNVFIYHFPTPSHRPCILSWLSWQPLDHLSFSIISVEVQGGGADREGDM